MKCAECHEDIGFGAVMHEKVLYHRACLKKVLKSSQGPALENVASGSVFRAPVDEICSGCGNWDGKCIAGVENLYFCFSDTRDN